MAAIVGMLNYSFLLAAHFLAVVGKVLGKQRKEVFFARSRDAVDEDEQAYKPKDNHAVGHRE